MNLFLRAKHWHLFVLTFGIPIVLEMVFISSIVSSFVNSGLMTHPGSPPDVTMIFGYFKVFFPSIMVLSLGGLFGWQYSVVTCLQKMVPAGVDMKLNRFKIFFFFPVVYLTLIILLLMFIFSGNLFTLPNPGPGFLIGFLIIFPLHLFSIFCMFYCIYFVAKTLKTVELQKETTFSDFVLEFFLLWFFPIGVWILQPRINKLAFDYDATGGNNPIPEQV